jgi:6-phosphogluconolactonase
VRKLRWDHGRAWLSTDGRAAEWRAAIELDDQKPSAQGPLARVHTFSVRATAQAPDSAVAVELKNFNASSGSYFARLGGELRAGAGAELRVTLRLPADCDGAGDVVQAVAAGIASAPARPRGHLDVRLPFVHPIDLKPWTWERCAATMLRLMAADVAAMSDDAAASAAEAVAAWRDSGPAPTIGVTPALFIADDPAAVMQMVTDRIRAVAAEALVRHERFRIALSGGSTPRLLYPRLVDAVDWKRADIFFGDERTVPPEDPQSNYRMVRETLLAPAHVPDANVFRWRGEAPDLDGAARDYAQALRARAAPPLLDLALLGLGPDGHTASLFPGTAALSVEDRLAVAVDVPAMGTRRLTLTYPVFLEAGEVFFLVTGRDKHAALADVLRPESALPAARIAHRPRSACIFCDREAAQDINPPA